MARDPSLRYAELIDEATPEVQVEEVGATSAPLLSASYFIGDRCRAYNDDFMLCKKESQNGPVDCLKEGRRVTRCAISVLDDINKHCLEQFRTHWQCLEQNNHQLYACRPAETLLNKCVFTKIGLKKTIPDSTDVGGVHQKANPYLVPAFPDGASQDELKATKKF